MQIDWAIFFYFSSKLYCTWINQKVLSSHSFWLRLTWLKISIGLIILRSQEDSHPFILHPWFLQFLEIWFEKYGSRNLVQEIWLEKSGWPEKKVVLYHKSTRNLVREKWLTRKKNWFYTINPQEIWFKKSGWPEKKVVLYHKFTRNLVREKWLTRKKIWVCRTTFLHFSRKVVAE